ncbi:Uncharacterised protein [Escherichia coli]|nr:Uncharacterised protein [Escherichia coli]
MHKVKPSPVITGCIARVNWLFPDAPVRADYVAHGVDQLTDFATKLRELGDVILGESLQAIADFTVLLIQRQQIVILANGS